MLRHWRFASAIGGRDDEPKDEGSAIGEGAGPGLKTRLRGSVNDRGRPCLEQIAKHGLQASTQLPRCFASAISPEASHLDTPVIVKMHAGLRIPIQACETLGQDPNGLQGIRARKKRGCVPLDCVGRNRV